MDRDFDERLDTSDVLKINLRAAYKMLSDVELDSRVPMEIRAGISTFLANRYYFAGEQRTKGSSTKDGL